IADDVVVMRHGKVVEAGPVEQIFHDPQHAYTQELLASLPQRETAAAGVRPANEMPARIEVRDAVETSVRHDAADAEPLLRIQGLRMEFDSVSGTMFSRGQKKKIVAVNDVSLQIARGSTLGLVGESGC